MKTLQVHLMIRIYATVVMGFLILGCETTTPHSSSSAYLSSWKQQLSTAKSEIQKIESDAKIQKVTLTSISGMPTNGDMEISIFFVRKSNKVIKFLYIIEKTQISTEIASNPAYYRNLSYPSESKQSCYEKALDYIQFGPYEAWNIANNHIKLGGDNNKFTVLVNLDACDSSVELFDVPSVWRVIYLSENKQVTVWVDPNSGEVIHKEEGL